MFSVYNNICIVYRKIGIYEVHETEISTFLLNPVIKELIEQVNANEPISETKKFLLQPVIQNIVCKCQSSDIFEETIIRMIKKKRTVTLRLLLHIKPLYSSPYQKEKPYYKVIDKQ